MQENPKKNSWKIVWLIAILLLLAVIATVCIYFSKMRTHVPTENEDVIELVPEENEKEDEKPPTAPVQEQETEDAKKDEPKEIKKNQTKYTGTVLEKRQIGLKEAQMTGEDKVTIWESETSVDLFKKAYKGTVAAGTENEITAQNDGSVDDKNIVAPGTGNSYDFWLKNTGAVGIDYQISFEESTSNVHNIPLEVRVKCGEKYILGSDSRWEPIESLNSLVHKDHLYVKHYAKYTLEWQWPFGATIEEDVRDTSLGNKALSATLGQKITIRTYGEAYERPIYDYVTVVGIQTGDGANVILWTATAGGAVLLFIVLLLCRRRKEKDSEE